MGSHLGGRFRETGCAAQDSSGLDDTLNQRAQAPFGPSLRVRNVLIQEESSMRSQGHDPQSSDFNDDSERVA